MASYTTQNDVCHPKHSASLWNCSWKLIIAIIIIISSSIIIIDYLLYIHVFSIHSFNKHGTSNIMGTVFCVHDIAKSLLSWG